MTTFIPNWPYLHVGSLSVRPAAVARLKELIVVLIQWSRSLIYVPGKVTPTVTFSQPEAWKAYSHVSHNKTKMWNGYLTDFICAILISTYEAWAQCSVGSKCTRIMAMPLNSPCTCSTRCRYAPALAACSITRGMFCCRRAAKIVLCLIMPWRVFPSTNTPYSY